MIMEENGTLESRRSIFVRDKIEIGVLLIEYGTVGRVVVTKILMESRVVPLLTSHKRILATTLCGRRFHLAFCHHQEWVSQSARAEVGSRRKIKAWHDREHDGQTDADADADAKLGAWYPPSHRVLKSFVPTVLWGSSSVSTPPKQNWKQIANSSHWTLHPQRIQTLTDDLKKEWFYNVPTSSLFSCLR